MTARAEITARLPERVLVDDAAAILGVPARTVQALAARGEIPAAKVGRSWTFDVKTMRRLVSAGAMEVHKARRHRTHNADATVYFIECAGSVKIGVTRNLPRRLKAIQAHAPCEICLIATIEAPASLERKLHARFAVQRRHGEWFEPIGPLADYLRRLGWSGR